MLEESRKIIHFDADLYSSELFALAQIYSVLKIGDIIFFDDFYVVEHDFRALMDWSLSHQIVFEMITHTTGFGKAAFRILSIGY